MMNFEELDSATRDYMLKEFRAEQNSENPYRSQLMTAAGNEQFVEIMERAITTGNEISLEQELANPSFWVSSTTARRKETTYSKSVDFRVAAKTFALTEFNTWYVRGFAKRLMDEGEKECEVYRADTAVEPRCECTRWQTQTFDVKMIYDGHRKRYHHETIDRSAIAVPSGPNCHHSIKRIKKEE